MDASGILAEGCSFRSGQDSGVRCSARPAPSCGERRSAISEAEQAAGAGSGTDARARNADSADGPGVSRPHRCSFGSRNAIAHYWGGHVFQNMHVHYRVHRAGRWAAEKERRLPLEPSIEDFSRVHFFIPIRGLKKVRGLFTGTLS